MNINPNHSFVFNAIIGSIGSNSLNIAPALSHIKNNRVWVLGAGKASVHMALSILEDGFDVQDGIVISHVNQSLGPIQVFRGSHPYPTFDSVSASMELAELAQSIPEGDEVVFCLSGGASSYLLLPPAELEVDEIAVCYEMLLSSGLNIQEMNTVRKQLCTLKNGGLAKLLGHTKLTSLIISDVPNNDLQVIGSAPTIYDEKSSPSAAIEILKKNDLWLRTPWAIRNYLESKSTVKNNDHPNHTIRLLNTPESFAKAVSKICSSKGFHSWVLPAAYNSDIKEVTKLICSKAISVLSRNDPAVKPAALIFFGESSVNLNGKKGKGGRNQELALTCALSLEGQHDVSMLSIGTDGLDGPTDAAGAVIDSYTTLKARKQKISPEEFLLDHNSYDFHDKMGTLLKTGPTGNNLMDLQVLLIE